MGLTPAPINAWYLAWIAIIPLWILTDKSSFLKTILLGLAWGFGYHGLALFWITGIHPMTWMGVPWLASLAIAFFCWIFISIWGAILVTIWVVGKNLFSFDTKNKLINAFFRVIIGVSFWCGLEFLWSQTDLWWSGLAYTQSPNNLAILQLSKFSGPSTIAASIVMINGLFAEAILALINVRRKSFYFLMSLGILSFTSLYILGSYFYHLPIETPQKNAIKVGIIQGNIPNEIKLYYSGWLKAIEGYTTGYQALATEENIDVILTPETALPFFYNKIVSNSSFYQAILEEKIPVFLGAYGNKGKDLTNSLFTITDNGEIFSQYDKIKLVPLGEYIPFYSFLGKFIDRLSPLDANLAKGKQGQIFDTPFGKAIVGICYESAFSQHFWRQAREGGEFIITSSNNAHYSTAMPAQHHAQDVMRAIETNRWAARATNTGYSAIVNPRGDTLWKSGINSYEIYANYIYRLQTQTLYVKLGDWLTFVLLLGSGFLIIIGRKNLYKKNNN